MKGGCTVADSQFTPEELAKIQAALKEKKEKERLQLIQEEINRQEQKHLGCE